MKTVKKQCLSCRKTFYPREADVKRGKGKCCSRTCSRERHSRIMSGRRLKPEHRASIKKAMQGLNKREQNPNWNGGESFDKTNGRWYVPALNHPHSRTNGYYLRSRWNVEQAIGRRLDPREVVHHIDEDKTNDDLSNLFIFPSRGKHTTYHNKLRTGKIDPITESNIEFYKER